MKPRNVLMAAVATAFAVSAVVALSANGQSGTTLTFKQATPGARAFKEIDVRPHGLSLGDQEIGAVSLRAGGRLAGRAEAVCTITDRAFQGRQCVVTLVLADGIITGQIAGLDRDLPGSHPSKADVFAVTGGTGSYRGASGTATISHPRSGDVVTVELEP